MTQLNKHLINDITVDDVVYRYFPFQRLQQLFESETMGLVRPELWDDPCENQLHKIQLVDSATGKSVSLDSIRKSYYGLCWTLMKESDAMWRIYSPDRTSVRVRTTVGKLLDAFVDTKDKLARMKFSIGKVEYQTHGEFEKLFSDAGSCFGAVTDSSGIAPIKCLLIKREAFQHEDEVRMIYREPDSKIDHGNAWTFPVNPNQLINQLCFDSRLPKKEFEKAVELFSEKYEFQGEIVRSTLYDLPAPPEMII